MKSLIKCQFAIKQSDKSKRKNKEYYDRKERFKPYKVGQYVYLHDPTSKKGPQKKFAKFWKGPYEIIEVINKLNYKIKTRADENPVVHYNRLKPSKVITRKRRRVIKPLPQRDSESESEVDDLDREQTVDETNLNEPFIVDTGPTLRTVEPTRQVSDLESEKKDSTVELRDIRSNINDPEWIPPPTQQTGPEIVGRYELRPRENIVAPRRLINLVNKLKYRMK